MADDVGRALGEIGRLVRSASTAEQVYEVLCDAAVRLIPACDGAAISVFRHDRYLTAAASDAVARRVDEIEGEEREGPCFDAAQHAGWEIHADLADVKEPNNYQRRVLDETPVRSILAFRLMTGERKSGSLNLTSHRPHAFDEQVGEQAAIFAAYASMAAEAADEKRHAQELQQALGTSRVIGAAIGILMASHGISREEAFEVLRRASQEMNRKLRDVADTLVQETERGAARVT